MKVEVLTIQGEKTGREIDLPAEIFEVEANEHAVYLDVKQHLANKRQGTHKSKERNEVVGSTRKIKRQKGTGTARAGDIKSPIFRGGGRVFGPRPRSYRHKLNRKVKRLARKSVLSDKLKNGQLMIVEDFSFDAPKTSEYVNILTQLDIAGKKSLLVTSDYEKEVYLSSRNLQKASVAPVSQLNTYDILNTQALILSESAIEKLTSDFGLKA